MRVREIKKEDFRVGLKVIHKGYHDHIYNDMVRIVTATKNVNSSHAEAVTCDNGDWDTQENIMNYYFMVEEDKPTGIPTFDGDLPKGTKLDQGKLKPTLLLDDMPLAIQEILKVLQFGARKYSEGNWLKVDNGISRYRNAADRHRLAISELDDESGLLHLAHEATSVLMLLELKLREKRDAE